MAHYEGAEAVDRVTCLVGNKRLSGLLFQNNDTGEADVPIRALINSAKINGRVLELHSRSFFHLRRADNKWCEESTGDIAIQINLDEHFILETWQDGFFIAYPPEKVRITLT